MSTTKETADIYIYGDIVSYEWYDSDTSSYSLAKAIDGLDVPQINVYINSYGGEVAEGLAIHNALQRHKAKVVTYCDGFACSAASVVFMAGDERIMYPASLLMIHNASTIAWGTSADFQKIAEDLETISDTSANAYIEHVNISSEELKELMNNETWIPPDEALSKGFATAIMSVAVSEKVSQNVRTAIFNKVLDDGKPQGLLFLDESKVGLLTGILEKSIGSMAQPDSIDEHAKCTEPEDKKHPKNKFFNFERKNSNEI